MREENDPSAASFKIEPVPFSSSFHRSVTAISQKLRPFEVTFTFTRAAFSHCSRSAKCALQRIHRKGGTHEHGTKEAIKYCDGNGRYD
jgi:hypothetical protein